MDKGSRTPHGRVIEDAAARGFAASTHTAARMRKAVKAALTPEFHHPTAKLVWLLRALLAGLALFALTVEPTYTTKPLLVFSAVAGLLVSVGFAFVPTKRPRTLRAAEAAVLLAFLGHVIGHTFGIYQRWAPYDTVLHFSVPLITPLILYALSQSSPWLWDWRKVSPVEVGIYLFALAVTFGTLWEILEFGMDQLAGTKEQDSLFDTMIDLIADAVGAALGSVAGAFATKIGRERGHDKVSEEPKREAPARSPREKGPAAE